MVKGVDVVCERYVFEPSPRHRRKILIKRFLLASTGRNTEMMEPARYWSVLRPPEAAKGSPPEMCVWWRPKEWSYVRCGDEADLWLPDVEMKWTFDCLMWRWSGPLIAWCEDEVDLWLHDVEMKWTYDCLMWRWSGPLVAWCGDEVDLCLRDRGMIWAFACVMENRYWPLSMWFIGMLLSLLDFFLEEEKWLNDFSCGILEFCWKNSTSAAQSS